MARNESNSATSPLPALISEVIAALVHGRLFAAVGHSAPKSTFSLALGRREADLRHRCTSTQKYDALASSLGVRRIASWPPAIESRVSYGHSTVAGLLYFVPVVNCSRARPHCDPSLLAEFVNAAPFTGRWRSSHVGIPIREPSTRTTSLSHLTRELGQWARGLTGLTVGPCGKLTTGPRGRGIVSGLKTKS